MRGVCGTRSLSTLEGRIGGTCEGENESPAANVRGSCVQDTQAPLRQGPRANQWKAEARQIKRVEPEVGQKRRRTPANLEPAFLPNVAIPDHLAHRIVVEGRGPRRGPVSTSPWLRAARVRSAPFRSSPVVVTFSGAHKEGTLRRQRRFYVRVCGLRYQWAGQLQLLLLFVIVPSSSVAQVAACAFLGTRYLGL